MNLHRLATEANLPLLPRECGSCSPVQTELCPESPCPSQSTSVLEHGARRCSAEHWWLDFTAQLWTPAVPLNFLHCPVYEVDVILIMTLPLIPLPESQKGNLGFCCRSNLFSNQNMD